MNINSKRILALVNLGLHIKNYSYNDPKYSKLDNCIDKSIILNKWFTREAVTNALKSWAYTLESKNIEKWISNYQNIGKKRALAVGIAFGIFYIICLVSIAPYQVYIFSVATIVLMLLKSLG